MSKPAVQVGVLMGSQSDWPVMQRCVETLDRLGIASEARVMSAHRSPQAVAEYASSAADRGLGAIVAAAGGAAHLAGVVAAHTHVPVLGVPMVGWSLDGLDSLLSTAQMPKGIPVATFAIGGPGAVNAALFAAAMFARTDDAVRERLLAFRAEQAASSVANPRQ